MMSVTGFVTIRSNLHVKFLDMKSRKNALLALNFFSTLMSFINTISYLSSTVQAYTQVS